MRPYKEYSLTWQAFVKSVAEIFALCYWDHYNFFDTFRQHWIWTYRMKNKPHLDSKFCSINVSLLGLSEFPTIPKLSEPWGKMLTAACCGFSGIRSKDDVAPVYKSISELLSLFVRSQRSVVDIINKTYYLFPK